MNDVQNSMAQLLTPLAPEVFECEDQSHLHAGHAGAREGGGHFNILVVSESFTGINRVARARNIQTLLKPLFDTKKIHALSITAQTPDEFFN